MDQDIISVGIDVGTSTTQLVFSRLKVHEEQGFGRAPKVTIADKEILYQSRIYETPLRSFQEIDGDAVRRLIEQEYRNAGFTPSQIGTGAVIITGESSRKSNADEVVHAFSALSGDFVVAEAGPDLEGVLAGKGAGSGELSKLTGKVTANLDIGGGTTNICVFQDGKVIDTACYNIGGRLLRVQEGLISYVSPPAVLLGEAAGIPLVPGERLTEEAAGRLCSLMAELLAEAVGLSEPSLLLKKMVTNRELSNEIRPELITFSGGVADCLESTTAFAFDDLGDLLGQAVHSRTDLMEKAEFPARETIRATVIGAGNYSIEISGSTIDYEGRSLPVKNVPVLRISCESQEDIQRISAEIEKKRILLPDESRSFAVAMKGFKSPSFLQLKEVADALAGRKQLVAVVLEEDMGKALGQALRRRMGNAAPVCVDEIRCTDGDYIDIGKPLGNSGALPVAVKTLLFGI